MNLSSRTTAIALALTFAACSGGGGGGSAPATAGSSLGTLTLTGTDTGEIGTEVNVGDVATIVGPGDIIKFSLIEQGSTFFANEFVFPESPFDSGNGQIGDPNNVFVLNVVDLGAAAPAGLDMAIAWALIVDGQPWEYACGGTISLCEGLIIDVDGRTIEFNDVMLEPTPTISNSTDQLLVNGVVRW